MFFIRHHLSQGIHNTFIINGRINFVIDKDDGERNWTGEFGDELASSEGEHWFGIDDLLGDFSSSVEGVGGCHDRAQRHHSQADDREEDGVRGQEKDGVALSNAHVRERRGN
ncbi:hypothetical protein TB1_024137 [Malus domestica]